MTSAFLQHGGFDTLKHRTFQNRASFFFQNSAHNFRFAEVAPENPNYSAFAVFTNDTRTISSLPASFGTRILNDVNSPLNL